VNCGGVIVQPGDIIFGDLDGLIAIPLVEEQKVIAWALNKVQNENHTRDALKQG
jgi:regulator of RNase E activity RraA